tara:strand:+ start:356 stop:955 length:600 start_codon:yes stop_codon:yes gene_type:complete
MLFIGVGFEVSYARFLFIRGRGGVKQSFGEIGVGVDSVEKETDVLFLFDVGFSIEKIAESKKMPLEDVQKIIAKRGSQTRQRKQKNIIQEIANQNPWKDGIPEHEVVMDVVRSMDIEDTDVESYGARTIPSKKIERADRSDRIGEDVELADRIEAAVKSGQNEEKEKLIFENLQKKRNEWIGVVAEVDELLNEPQNNED